MEAYRTAEDVLNDPAASQNDIDRAWSKLLDALHYLEFKPGDKSGLENLYEILKILEEDHYTSTGWDAFQEALDRAEEVLHGERHWTSAEMQVRKKSIQQPKLW